MGPVQAVIERTVSGMGYELVDVEIAGRGLLRVYIDLPPGAPPASEPPGLPPSIRMEDCERVSHQLSHVLAVENVDYARLEVSSPGVDRPLKKPADYERFAGEPVQVRLREAFAGRRNFEGVLVRDESEPGRWALELVEPEAKPVRGKKPLPKSGKANTTGRAAAKRPAPEATAEPGVETVRRLSFTLDEIERARLVPKLKF